MVGCHFGHLAAVKKLTQNGEEGATSIVQLLLKKGVDVNAGEGHTYSNALQATVCGGHVAVARLLVANGADVGEEGKCQHDVDRAATPLYIAAFWTW